jgi:hypothetical protein
MRKAIILLLLVSLQSCKSQNSVPELALKECVNESINNNVDKRLDKEPIDFYSFSLQLETFLISKNLLKNKKKNTYYELLININENTKDNNSKEAYNEIIGIMDRKGFDFNLYQINDNIFNQCPYKVSLEQKDEEDNLIYSQGRILNMLMEQGFTNDALFKELINDISDKNFEKIVYRAPVILLVIINLNSKYGNGTD